MALAVHNEALKRGAWVIWDSEEQIRFYPAMNMEEEVLERGLTITEEAIREVEKNYRPNEYPFWTTGILW